MQRTARNYRAYDQSQRSSRVTADVVYRLGYTPKPVDIKTTIGTMPRRHRGGGRRSQYGGTLDLADVNITDLRTYVSLTRIDVRSSKKSEIVAALTEMGHTYSDIEATLGRAPSIVKDARKRENLLVFPSRRKDQKTAILKSIF